MQNIETRYQLKYLYHEMKKAGHLNLIRLLIVKEMF